MKTYLGDGVYAELTPFGEIVLTTEDGISATNTIVLDSQVLLAFERWIAKLKEQAQ
jgi:hypothetical protein